MIIDKDTLDKAVSSFTASYFADKNSRYKSYDHIKRFFMEHRKTQCDEVKNEIALHLYSYLASWGMLRNSFLMQKDYLFNKRVVDVLCLDKYDPLILIDYYQDYENYIDLILELRQDIRNCYLGETYFDEGVSRPVAISRVSDTLVSKIILGTFGCTLAYDRYVTSALRHCSVTGMFGAKSLKDVANILTDNRDSIETILEDKHLDKKLYTPIKILDMYFFEYGLQIETGANV